MLRAHTVEQVRAAEAAVFATLPSGAEDALMLRAARGLAHAVIDLLGGAVGRRVLLLVGSGDNGGDALHAGAVLARRGAAVEAWLLGSAVHEGGLAALRAAGGRARPAGEDVPTLPELPATWRAAGADVVLDAVVGIGGRPGLRPAAERALAAVEAYGTPIVAVDIPSGVDVDTGATPERHVRAALTVTFGTLKPCHLLDPAASACGAVHLVDLDLDLPPAAVEALQPHDVAALVPRPAPDAHKYTRGVVGVRAGSATYPGAGLLSVAGAACGLAGMVRHVGDDTVRALVRAAHPEVVGDGRVQAWVVGSGSDTDAAEALRACLEDDVPLVVDADAIAHADLVRGRPAVLTPHAGELARLTGVEREQVEAEPLRHARAAAADLGVVVLLKGRRTLAAHPDGRVRVTTTGTPWLATAGAGDVLGGLIGALLAGGLDPFDAASVGSWLHGAAATAASSGGPIVAGDVARALPGVLARLLDATPQVPTAEHPLG
ncbi:NAD(P)H-hydrate dehydratase [Nocardioides sp.]|uniref:NAD(P)H-hydrate dehydratase n=1 Tax=Nocardioides sp. TaxID=35761 RepID=UPI0035195B5B